MSEKELLAQIAQVAGAINKHMNTPPAPYYPNGYAPTRGGYNARGRGRGRGMPYSSYNPVHNSIHGPSGAFNRTLTLNNTQPPPSLTRPPVAARHLSLMNSNNNIKTGDSSTASTPVASPAVSPPASSSSAPPTPPVTPASTPTGQWIQTKTKNMSMMNPSTYQKTMVAKQNSIRSAKVAKLKMHQERAKKAADLRKGIVRVGDKVYSKSLDGRKLVMRDPNQGDIVINGATFQMDPRGNKLIRKIGTGSPASGNGATISTATPTTKHTFGSSGATPKQFAVDGVVYVRTTSGNLVRATLVKSQLLAKRAAQEALKAKRNKGMARKRQFCKYFTRFGQCTNIRCPFMHSRQHLSICKRFLRGQCHFTDATCKLSHTPSPHTTPACSHFQYAACTKDECLYPHIKVNAQAPICKPFAKEGWCEAGATCKDRHVWICPDFDTPTGCKIKCGLAHVANGGIRVKKTAEEIERDRQNGIFRQKKNGSDPQGNSAWSGRYMDRPTPDSPKDTAKVREYDENFIPLDFDSADEDEGAMLQMQVESHESAEDEDADVEEEEDVNSDVEMDDDDDEEEREEEMGEEEEGEEDEEEKDEEENDDHGFFAAFEDEDEDGFYR